MITAIVIIALSLLLILDLATIPILAFEICIGLGSTEVKNETDR